MESILWGIVLHQELEENFKLYKRKMRRVYTQIIFRFVGIALMFGMMAGFPRFTIPIFNVIFSLASFVLFFAFFVLLLNVFSQIPSAEKRIFANFYKSLKFLRAYEIEHDESDFNKAKKHLKKTVHLLKKAPSSEFEIVGKKIKTEVDPVLGELAKKNSIKVD